MSYSVRTRAGDGVLARYGGSLVLAPADSPVLDAVLELAREAAREHADVPGTFLPRKVAGILAQSDDTPTLALVSALADGLAVVLVGDVTLTLTDEAGTSTLSGRDASTWVDKIVRNGWTALTLTLAGAGAVDARSDLQGGVVTAGGAELSPDGTPVAVPAKAEAPAVPAPPAEAPAFESFSLAAEDPVEAAPLPVAQTPEPVAPAAPEEPVPGSRSTIAVPARPVPSGTQVQGIMCSRQHFNDPTAVYCAVCGISMVHQTHNLVTGTRPPLGVVVLDDGAVLPLDRDYVLGREPEGAPEVADGTATALTLDDPEVTMSRLHAKLLLVGWEVRFVDAGSANGSFFARSGETAWTRLGSGESVVLTPGTRAAIGSRTFVFDSHHKL